MWFYGVSTVCLEDMTCWVFTQRVCVCAHNRHTNTMRVHSTPTPWTTIVLLMIWSAGWSTLSALLSATVVALARSILPTVEWFQMWISYVGIVSDVIFKSKTKSFEFSANQVQPLCLYSVFYGSWKVISGIDGGHGDDGDGDLWWCWSMCVVGGGLSKYLQTIFKLSSYLSSKLAKMQIYLSPFFKLSSTIFKLS